MLKRIMIFMLVGVLSLTLIPAYALGNDWTFTPLWYEAVIKNSYAIVSNGEGLSREGSLVNLFPKNELNTYTLILGDSVLDNSLIEYEYDSPAIVYPFNTDFSLNGDWEDCNYYDITFPLNVRVEEGQTLNIHFFEMFNNTSQFSPTSIRLTTASGERIYLTGSQIQKSKYDDAGLGTWTLNQSGQPIDFEKKYSGNLSLYNISYTYIPSVDLDRPQGIDIKSISVYINTNGWGGYFGFIPDNPEYIALPSYVEENLVEINNTTAQISDDVKEQISQLNEIYSKLFEINANMNKNNSVATQYYQTIITPSQEQIVKQEELAQKVEEAKEQLAEIQSIIEKEPAVSYDDIESVTSQADISIDEALNNEDTKKFLELLFNNSLISTMLVAVIALATVGYVLFGKKG